MSSGTKMLNPWSWIKATVSCLMWLLGTTHGSSARTESALNCCFPGRLTFLNILNNLVSPKFTFSNTISKQQFSGAVHIN